MHSHRPVSSTNRDEIKSNEPKKEEQNNATTDQAPDFTFKMPTKLLGSTIGKSDTMSSNMLSYKFTKENLFYQESGSAVVDRDCDEYQK